MSKELVKLLKTCADGYPTIQKTLQLEHFLPLFRYLANDTKRDMAVYLLEVVCGKEAHLDSLEHVRLCVFGGEGGKREPMYACASYFVWDQN